jgi:hypothetical protein
MTILNKKREVVPKNYLPFLFSFDKRNSYFNASAIAEDAELPVS